MGGMLRWSWLLGLALIVPADLPAGGAQRQPLVRRRHGTGPLYTSAETSLHSSPMSVAPPLRHLSAGTSLRLLRRWRSEEGKDWFHVQDLSGDLGEPQRGWIRV